MDFKPISARNASYVALAASLVALSITTFLALSIDHVVDDSVRDAVMVTKVRLAELDAAASVEVARSEFARHKSFAKLESELASIGSKMSSAYAAAPASEQEYWHHEKMAFDAAIAKAKAKDTTVLADLDALVAKLRAQR